MFSGKIAALPPLREEGELPSLPVSCLQTRWVESSQRGMYSLPLQGCQAAANWSLFYLLGNNEFDFLLRRHGRTSFFQFGIEILNCQLPSEQVWLLVPAWTHPPKSMALDHAQRPLRTIVCQQKGKLFYLQLEIFCVRLSIFVYSLLMCLSDTVSHYKQQFSNRNSNCKQKTLHVSKKKNSQTQVSVKNSTVLVLEGQEWGL